MYQRRPANSDPDGREPRALAVEPERELEPLGGDRDAMRAGPTAWTESFSIGLPSSAASAPVTSRAASPSSLPSGSRRKSASAACSPSGP